MKKKIIYIVLTVIWMVVIFIMSSMNTNESNGKSKQTIKKTVQKTTEISENIGITDTKPTEKQVNETVNKLNFPLRKCAHATEYAILAILIIFTLNSFWGKNYSIKKIFIAIIVCFIYSLASVFKLNILLNKFAENIILFLSLLLKKDKI